MYILQKVYWSRIFDTSIDSVLAALIMYQIVGVIADYYARDSQVLTWNYWLQTFVWGYWCVVVFVVQGFLYWSCGYWKKGE